MGKQRKLRFTLYNIEGAKMEGEANSKSEDARIEFAHMLGVGLESYGFKKKKESFNQFFTRVEKRFNELNKKSK